MYFWPLLHILFVDKVKDPETIFTLMSCLDIKKLLSRDLHFTKEQHSYSGLLKLGLKVYDLICHLLR